MNKYNSLDVDLDDLIRYMENHVEYKRESKQRDKIKRSAFMVDHDFECAEQILTLLKNEKKRKQPTLFQQKPRS